MGIIELKMKNITTAAAAGALILPFVSFADTEVIDGITWNYYISNGNVKFGNAASGSYNAVAQSTSGAIKIPDSLGGVKITCITYGAFWYSSSLSSVKIPDSVTSIGECAFYNCSGLKSISIPAKVKSIGKQAFNGCSGIKSLKIPSGVTTIGENAFNGPKLTTLDIPASVTSIGDRAFYTSSLKVATIPARFVYNNTCFNSLQTTLEKLTIIPSADVDGVKKQAYLNCRSLTSVVVADGIKSIKQSAFEGCANLSSVTIPNSLTNLYTSAFKSCSAIKEVHVPGGWKMTELFPAAYQTVTNAVVNEGATFIRADKFSGCSGLQSVSIPDSVTKVNANAFLNCSSLETVTIPEKVASIGSNAFGGCSSLKALALPASFLGQTAGMGIPDGCSVTFYSKLTLDRQGGSGGVTSVTANYDSAMPAVAIPTRTGDVFCGYYAEKDGGGTQYYTAAGESACNWDVAATTTLYAKWVPAYDRTQTTPENVPYSWLRGFYPDTPNAYASYEAVAMSKAANGRPVWECYVADLDPDKPDDDLVATIEFEDGEPIVKILRGKSENRQYQTLGAPSPSGPWGTPDDTSRFFKISVSIP